MSVQSEAMDRAKRKPPIEVRYAVDSRNGKRFLDEVVATNASVHLESMNEQSFCLVVETSYQRVQLYIGSANTKGHVSAFEVDNSPVNPWSLGQRRRWARTRAAKGLAAQRRQA